ncbi:TIGR03086 family metal-binding protein [Intrasporangium sp.]|uniref:TIGR03086 family metal-binding protein n=1 Tax=Intrasporangium sp. TaxID=1925024 RepID=UPI00293B5B29|nr:TIGR03086 family metal-binding protein [Intrasporangium sp.]MDV3221142.1 TIGR03086 family metal-binding protein [Intrasporangium sp.]
MTTGSNDTRTLTTPTTSDTTPDTAPEHNPVLGRFSALADAFGAVVHSLPHDAWDAPSACEGWTGRDVLDHVVGSQRGFLRARGIELGPDPALDEDPVAGWHAHVEELRRLLADESVAGLEYDGLFGRTTVGATITDFYGFDLVVHRWDLARAADRDERFTDAELDLVETALPAFGEHLYDDGVCKPALPVPADSDRQTALLARLGRSARAGS